MFISCMDLQLWAWLQPALLLIPHTSIYGIIRSLIGSVVHSRRFQHVTFFWSHITSITCFLSGNKTVTMVTNQRE